MAKVSQLERCMGYGGEALGHVTTGGNGAARRFIGMLRDMTHKRCELEQLRRILLHDALTGLPNRRLLADRFHQMDAHAPRDESRSPWCSLI